MWDLGSDLWGRFSSIIFFLIAMGIVYVWILFFRRLGREPTTLSNRAQPDQVEKSGLLSSIHKNTLIFTLTYWGLYALAAIIWTLSFGEMVGPNPNYLGLVLLTFLLYPLGLALVLFPSGFGVFLAYTAYFGLYFWGLLKSNTRVVSLIILLLLLILNYGSCAAMKGFRFIEVLVKAVRLTRFSTGYDLLRPPKEFPSWIRVAVGFLL